jgi:hypothetical protein
VQRRPVRIRQAGQLLQRAAGAGALLVDVGLEAGSDRQASTWEPNPVRQDLPARHGGAQSPALHLVDQLQQLQDLAGAAAAHLVDVQLAAKSGSVLRRS